METIEPAPVKSSITYDIPGELKDLFEKVKRNDE